MLPMMQRAARCAATAARALAAASAPTVGGQAVMEGVMMRAKEGWAVAVRLPSGEIARTVRPYVPLARKFPVLKLPILRGAISLIEMLVIGTKSLQYSTEQAMAAEEAARRQAAGASAGEPGAGDGAAGTAAAGKPAGPRYELVLTMIISLGLGIGLFVVLPNLLTHFLGGWATNGRTGKPLLEEERPVFYNLISGGFRMVIVVGYIWLISRMEDIQRMFRYHGAEHQAVSAFEAGQPLTVENIRPFTIFHPRCGTTFIAIVLLVSILVFAVFANLLAAVWPAFHLLPFWPRKLVLIAGHIVIMPVVAGICFELLRLGGKYPRNPLLMLLITPGYWFQRLTVKVPNDSMIEVAIRSLEAALAIAPGERQRDELLAPSELGVQAAAEIAALAGGAKPAGNAVTGRLPEEAPAARESNAA